MKNIFLGLLLSFFITAHADDEQTFQYTGFRQGQLGIGGVLGMPTGLRIQRFLSWRSAVFFTAGYNIDRFIEGDINYSYYVMAEEDPWQKPGQVGHILYNVFGGVTTGLPLRQGDTARFGVRGGIAFEYLLPSTHWALRAEVAPVIYLSGATAAGLQNGIVVSYYFGETKTKIKK